MLRCWFLNISFMNVFTQNTVQVPLTEAGMLIMNLWRISLDCHILKGSTKFWRESGRSGVLLVCSCMMKILGLVSGTCGIYFLKDALCFQLNPISLRSILLGHTWSFLFLLNVNAHVKGLIFNMVINPLFTKSGRLVGTLYFSTRIGRWILCKHGNWS